MRLNLVIIIAAALFLYSCSASRKSVNNKDHFVKIETDSGNIIVQLYNKTPLHRDNFIKLAKEKYFDGILFHRVIQHFMIQGGDPDSKGAPAGKMLGEGGLKYTVPAEFDSTLFHKKGALAAAREGDDVNPKKESSSTQFYIVQGKVFTDAQLDLVEKRIGRKIPGYQREIYKTIGGAPHLDGSYTVFGEVVSGMAVVDKIAAMPVDKNNRPLTDIKMKIRLLKKFSGKPAN
ncbi:MAG: peptidylprolyl isomerase [Bacteroidetes bacterium]|nr:peptidylprolyl isomerase [Bacteroidota bacterium]